MNNEPSNRKLAILVGGGPTPGINGVISAVTIEAVNQGMEVIGFHEGFRWLAEGDGTHCQPLSTQDVKAIHLRGGSILGTSRANPADSEDRLRKVLELLHRREVTSLVTIGGDGNAYSASKVHAGRRDAPGCPRAQNHRQ
jgi:6-phosphofructokinase 1